MTEHEPRTPARALIPLLAGGLLLLSGNAEAIMLSEEPQRLHDVSMDLLASRDDCEQGLSFTWQFADVMTNDSISVWGSSGDDCTLQENRNQNTGNCKQLLTDAVNSGGMSVSVTVSVEDLTKAYPESIENCVDSATGNITRPTQVYFLVNEAGGDVAESYMDSVTLDFVGPAATQLTSLSPASATSLNASWDGITGEADPSYTLYCQMALDGSEAGGDSGEGTCGAADLVPGELPPSGGCGDSSGTSGEATALQEGTLYAIGVAAVDNINNPGFLSNLKCATPEPVIGFYDTIGDVDSLCTIANVSPSPTRWGWIALGLGWASVGIARRRRRGAR